MSEKDQKIVSDARQKIDEAISAVKRCDECLTDQNQVLNLMASKHKLDEAQYWFGRAVK